MSFEQVVAFLIFAVVTSITPGPNNIMLTATGANVGMRRGLPHMFGIALGFALMLFLVAAGVGRALLASPASMDVLRYVGIAVLLWLAWKISTAGRTADSGRDRPIGFLEAAAFQWFNPKAWLICAGTVGGFLRERFQRPMASRALRGDFRRGRNALHDDLAGLRRCDAEGSAD